jgi:hypothetical protein
VAAMSNASKRRRATGNTGGGGRQRIVESVTRQERHKSCAPLKSRYHAGQCRCSPGASCSGSAPALQWAAYWVCASACRACGRHDRSGPSRVPPPSSSSVALRESTGPKSGTRTCIWSAPAPATRAAGSTPT